MKFQNLGPILKFETIITTIECLQLQQQKE